MRSMPADNDAWKKLRWNFNCKGDAGIIPVQQHLGGVKIFDNNETDEFKDLFVDRMIPVHGSKTQTRKIQCDSYNDAKDKAGSIFSAGAGDPAIGQILCKSMYAERKNTSTEHSVSILLLHILHPKFKISLPEEPEIQKYLDPDFRKRLNAIQSKEDAKDLVEKMGGGLYITSATFGGMRIKTKSAQVRRHAHDNTKTKGFFGRAKFSSAPGDIGPVVTASFEKTKQAAGSKNAKNENTVDKCVGGDTNKAKDDAYWINSIEGNEDIVELKLARISGLVPAPKTTGAKKFFNDLGRNLIDANPTIDKSRKDDLDDNPDKEMTKEREDKKKWLDDSITEYANARYNTEVEREMKQRVIRELEKIRKVDVKDALEANIIKKKNVIDIVDTPVEELIKKIKNNPAMTVQEIDKELRKIKEAVEERTTKRRHFDKNEKKVEFYEKIHRKIKGMMETLSPTIPV